MPNDVLVSIVVVSYNTCSLLRDCLASINRTKGNTLVEVWVVDNASVDGSGDMVAKEFPEARLVRNTDNLGFSAANNQAIARAEGKFILLLNSDTVLLPGSLRNMVEAFEHKSELGVCGAQLLNPDGSLQPSWGNLPNPIGEFFFQSFLYRIFPYPNVWGRHVHCFLKPSYGFSHKVGWVSGAALMMRFDVCRQLGGLSETYFFGGEDIEFCDRTWASGFEVLYVAEAQVIHHLGSSARRDYAGWIQNYTQALLSYHRAHSSRSARFVVAQLIVWGSVLRMLIWTLIALTLPSRKPESTMRCAGYQSAIKLALAMT